MKVTKTIREYVESEINKKFEPQLASLGVDYNQQKNEAINMAKEFVIAANSELIRLLKERGMYSYQAGYYYRDPISFNSSCIGDKNTEDRIAQQRREITRKRDAAIKDLLLGLELGETNKNTLRAALDAISVE